MRDRIKAAIERHGLIRPGDAVLLGLSGGADSVALLYALFSLREELGFALFAGHFNHQLRPEAEADEAFVCALCQKLDVPLRVGRWAEPRRAGSTNVELAARQARYAFLRAAAAACGGAAGPGKIALAHHREDQAESMLLHLTRGSGLSGLCGMRYETNGVIRPMLDVSRAEIEAYLAAQSIPYCVDKTNFDGVHARSFLRQNVLPELEKLNPQAISALCSAAQLLQQDEDYLAAQAKAALAAARLPRGYDRQALLQLPRPLLSRAIRLALAEGGADTDVEREHVDRVIRLLSQQTGRGVDLPHVRVSLSYGAVRFDPAGAAQAPEDFCLPLCPNGLTATPCGSFFAETIAGNRFSLDPMTAYFDLDKLPCGLVVRRRQNGDRFHPLGAPGSRKLKDYFIDKKAPREAREIPLVCAGSAVLFAPGFGIAEQVKTDETTRRMLRVHFEQDQQVKQGE